MAAITIVTYNSAPFIRRCLEYVFEQDYSPYEVIVIDNASKTPHLLFCVRLKAAFASCTTSKMWASRPVKTRLLH